MFMYFSLLRNPPKKLSKALEINSDGSEIVQKVG